MTREENAAKLVKLRSEAEALVKSYNEARLNKEGDEWKIESELTEKVNEYTSIVRDMCFEDCKNSENPMLTAVTTLRYVTIGVKEQDVKVDNRKVPVLAIVEKEKPIDLYKLHNYCGSIGANENWIHIVQKFNFLLTAQKCIDLGINPKTLNDSYAMSEIAREIDMGVNPASRTKLLKTLQTVVTAMIGEGYKATSHDVAFLISVYSKKDRKALTVACANHRSLRNYLAEICHRIVVDKSYAIKDNAKKNG